VCIGTYIKVETSSYIGAVYELLNGKAVWWVMTSRVLVWTIQCWSELLF